LLEDDDVAVAKCVFLQKYCNLATVFFCSSSLTTFIPIMFILALAKSCDLGEVQVEVIAGKSCDLRKF
jgi:hypothetical protein